MTPTDETRPLRRVLRGQHARQALAPLVADAPRELCLDGTGITRIDAYGGAIVRAAVQRHIGRDQSHLVEIREPANDRAWSLLYNLLGGALPSRAAWSGARDAPTRDLQVLLPAMLLDDETVALLTDEALPRVLRKLGYSDRKTRAAQEAAAVFAANAMTHGAKSTIPPVLCCALDEQGNDLQVVVLDLGPGGPTDDDGGPAVVQDAVRRSRSSDFGALAALAGRHRDGLPLSVRLAYGTGRGRYRTGESWHYSAAPYVPGFIAGLEIHC